MSEPHSSASGRAATSRRAHVRYREAGWRGWVDCSWAQRIEGDPLEWIEACAPETVGERPSALTVRAATGGGAVYAKHMTAVRDRAGRGDPLGRLKWRLRPSRAVRVLRVSRRLERAGFAVPHPVLAARRRDGWTVDDLLITLAVAGESLQERMVHEPDDARRERLLRLAGRRAAELHRRGFTHGDLLPGNMLVVADDRDLVFLDNDRTRRWWPLVPARARQRNVLQALYRLVYWVGYRRTRAFLDAYYETLGRSRAARRGEIARLLRRVRPRLHAAYRRHGRLGLGRRPGGPTPRSGDG